MTTGRDVIRALDDAEFFVKQFPAAAHVIACRGGSVLDCAAVFMATHSRTRLRWTANREGRRYVAREMKRTAGRLPVS